ncbi:MAG: hypothetical protein ACOYY2_02960 [Actinomycetota bacterium]
MNDPRGEAAWTDPVRPPAWGMGLTRLAGDTAVWVTWLPEDTTHPHLWHWCSHREWGPDAESGWGLAGVGAHDVVSRDPLTLSPSVSWPSCCGLHGFVRAGRWVSA